MKQESAILSVLKYFDNFQYPPTLREIWLFSPTLCNKKRCQLILNKLIKEKRVKRIMINKESRYSLRDISKRNLTLRFKLTKKKLKKIEKYSSILKLFPQIKFLGISGSLSVLARNKDDDIDVFIITSRNRLWFGRFIATILAITIGLKRERGLQKAPDKLCLNLFFDSKDLTIPESKRNIYIAHELLQLKPIITKSNAYSQLLEANAWVSKLLPNTKGIFQKNLINTNIDITTHTNFIGDIIEKILKKIQLFIINRHKTTELITNTQLWFFPQDFEKIIMKKLKKGRV